MSETSTVEGRDSKSGRFLSGCKPGPGRKVGSRNQLASDFVRDLASAWQQHGIQALDDCATKEPATFCKIIASLLPRHVDLNLSSVDVSEFAQRFATAIELLGNAEAPIPRRPLKVINGR